MNPKFTLATCKEVPLDQFEICKHEDGRYLIRFIGNQSDLADNLIALGIIHKMFKDGEEIYLIINEADVERFIK